MCEKPHFSVRDDRSIVVLYLKQMRQWIVSFYEINSATRLFLSAAFIFFRVFLIFVEAFVSSRFASTIHNRMIDRVITFYLKIEYL